MMGISSPVGPDGQMLEPAAKIARSDGGIAGSCPMDAPKGRLNMYMSKMVAKITGRKVDKDDLKYETYKVEGNGYQTSVTLPGLPGEWGAQMWVGNICPKKQDAEHSAAGMAIETIHLDTGLMHL